MCELSEKLIAWLDHELSAEDAANLARHIDNCAACRDRVEVYRRVSETIDAYCDAALVHGAKDRSRRRIWRPVFAAAAAVLLFFLTRPGEHFRALLSPAPDGIPAIAFKAPAVPVQAFEKLAAAANVAETTAKRVNPQRVRHKVQPLPVSRKPNENWFSNEAPVYIAIPADALFPPGAFPEGVGFVADVNLRPDGSARRLRLQPQLVGFQTRGARQ